MPVDTHLFDEQQEAKESMNGISYFLLKLEVISDATLCESDTEDFVRRVEREKLIWFGQLKRKEVYITVCDSWLDGLFHFQY